MRPTKVAFERDCETSYPRSCSRHRRVAATRRHRRRRKRRGPCRRPRDSSRSSLCRARRNNAYNSRGCAPPRGFTPRWARAAGVVLRPWAVRWTKPILSRYGSTTSSSVSTSSVSVAAIALMPTGPPSYWRAIGVEICAVEAVEAAAVDALAAQRFVRHRLGDDAVGAHFGEVAHPPQQAVRDARRAARARRDLRAPSGSIGDLRAARAALDDALQLLGARSSPGGARCRSGRAAARRAARRGRRADQREALERQLERFACGAAGRRRSRSGSPPSRDRGTLPPPARGGGSRR